MEIFGCSKGPFFRLGKNAAGFIIFSYPLPSEKKNIAGVELTADPYRDYR